MMPDRMSDEPEAANSLPANIEAEAALLGAMMVQNKMIDRVVDLVGPQHFFEPLHGRIFAAITREHGLGRNANPISLRPYFEADDAMKQVGGGKYLAQLTGSGAAVIGMVDLAAQVVELAQRRMMLARFEELTASVRDYELGLPDILASAEAALAEVTHEADDGALELSAGECADRALKTAEDRDLQGVRCGIEAIDTVLGPIRAQQMIVLAARPGMGKSCTASSYALGAAKRGHGVLFISYEMSAEEIGGRMICDMSFEPGLQAVPLHLLERGELDRPQMRRAMESRDALDKLPLQVVDIASGTTGKLNSLVRRWKRRFAARGIKLELVVIDYLQKLRPDFKCRDIVEKISEVSQAVKSCAKANEVGILALAQLSRAVEQRTDKRPILSDLRESGQIEQDADAVLFLYRSEYYLRQAEPALGDDAHERWEAAIENTKGQIEFICAKRRQGTTGKSFGLFHGGFQAVR